MSEEERKGKDEGKEKVAALPSGPVSSPPSVTTSWPNSEMIKSGRLLKKSTRFGLAMKDRFFVLLRSESGAKMKYFASEADYVRNRDRGGGASRRRRFSVGKGDGGPLGSFSVTNAVVHELDHRSFSIQVPRLARVYELHLPQLAAQSELSDWVIAIRGAAAVPTSKSPQEL